MPPMETIKILFLAADPQDITRLQIDNEMRAIDQALRITEYRDRFDLRSHWAVRYSDLQELLLRYKPQIVHFSGHGSQTGEIMLASEHGVHPVTADALSSLFSILKDNLHCVVLNACYSEVQARAIATHIDCVIGVSGAIGDQAALNFASSFYQALGYGRSIKEAFDLGRTAINLANLEDGDTLRLLTLSSDLTQVGLFNTSPSEAKQEKRPVLTPSRVGPGSPFIGPIPFHTDHAALFFGRDAQLARLVNLLLRGNSPLLVVNGLSGVGKTSLLRAGLVPRLKAQEFTVAYTSILDSPESDTMRGIQLSLSGSGELSPVDIPNAINLLACPFGRPVILVVDQIERCFSLAQNNIERLNFWRGIARLIRGEVECPTKIVLAVRSDWLYAFQDVTPMPLEISVFNFLYQLEPLKTDEAREALIGPLQLFHIAYEPELIETIIQDLTFENRYVNPPQLQIVGEALYKHLQETKAPETARLTLQDYQQLHGARTIIREHLLRIVNSLGPNAEICWQILLRLAGPEQLRASRPAEELRGNIAPPLFDSIMSHLVNNALVVREISAVSHLPVYTLTHDYLLEEINSYIAQNHQLQAWRTAEHYLDTGLIDWREVKEKKYAELLLERERYQYIWSHKEVFEALAQEAYEFLARTALYHGEVSFSHWLNKLSELDYEAPEAIVKDYVLHNSASVRMAARTALIQARQQNLLDEKMQQQLAEFFWHLFEVGEARQGALEPDSIQESDGHASRSQTRISAVEIREATAIVLWALRKFVRVPRLLKVTPVVSQVWLRMHRASVFLSLGSGLSAALIVFTLWIVNDRLRGTWEQLPTLYAGSVIAAAWVKGDPNSIYVVTPGGPEVGTGATLLLHRPDRGTWEIISKSFTSFPTYAFLVTESEGQKRFYASRQGRGLLRSNDNGKTWRPINSGLRSYLIVALVQDEHDPNIIFAGSGDGRGVFESTDGGDTWHDISGQELFGSYVSGMAYTAYEGGALIVATGDGRILARKRGSEIWETRQYMRDTGAVTSIWPEQTKREVIYAGTVRGDIWISFDGGGTWGQAVKPPEVYRINAVMPVPGQEDQAFISTYGIGGNLIWKTDFYGQTWEPLPDNQFTREYLALYIHEAQPETLYAFGEPGFFATRNQGITWHYYDDLGSPIAPAHRLVVSPVSGGPTYLAVNGSIFSRQASTDAPWQRGHGVTAMPIRDLIADLDDQDRAYASVYLPTYWSVLKTLDGGRTWFPTTPPQGIPVEFLNDTYALILAKEGDQEILYAGTNGCGVIYSTNQGNSWETFGRHDCQLGQEAPKNVIDIAVNPNAANNVYVAADNTHMYSSQDYGRSWQVAEQLPITDEITEIGADPQVAGRVYLIAGASGFWRSDDGARHWSLYSSGLEESALNNLLVVPGMAGTVYVSAISGQVWKTTDGGAQWVSVVEDLKVSFILEMSYDAQNQAVLISGGQDGLYRYQPGSLSSIWEGKGGTP